MARYPRRGRYVRRDEYEPVDRRYPTRQERYRGSTDAGLKVATIILGALLIVSVVLTVAAWIGRNNAHAALNALQKKFENMKMGKVTDEREKHHERRLQTGVAPGCDRCAQLKRELDGTKIDLGRAYDMLTLKQKERLVYNHDISIIPKTAKVDYVADPSNRDQFLLQISFTLLNKSQEARGNIDGVFRFFDNTKMIWQKKFKVDYMAAGAKESITFMAPGALNWKTWGCQIYPFKPSNLREQPRQ